ncbi:MAG: RNA 2',3'-cyclic phosphodiesterase [Thermoleophilia bacterium]|jgi:2'-5' RNA ligase
MSRDYPARSSRRQGRGERYAEGRGSRHVGRGGQREPSFRLFFAVDIPENAVDGLVLWQSELLASERMLRITPAGQLHITLVFLGKMGEKEKDIALEHLGAVNDRSAIEATATGIVGLPRDRSPRVIAARIAEPAGRIAAIYNELAAALEEKELYKREKRPFFPHVTIARTRGRSHLELSEMHPEPVKFTAVRITLYNSILKANGAEHVALKSVQLN